MPIIYGVTLTELHNLIFTHTIIWNQHKKKSIIRSFVLGFSHEMRTGHIQCSVCVYEYISRGNYFLQSSAVRHRHLLKLICSSLGSQWHLSSITSKWWKRLGILFLMFFSSCWNLCLLLFNLCIRQVVSVPFQWLKKKKRHLFQSVRIQRLDFLHSFYLATRLLAMINDF